MSSSVPSSDSAAHCPELAVVVAVGLTRNEKNSATHVSSMCGATALTHTYKHTHAHTTPTLLIYTLARVTMQANVPGTKTGL